MVIEPNKPTFGLRLIAVIEAVKGSLGLVLGSGLLCCPQNSAMRWLTGSLHLEGLFPLETWMLLAFGYAALRFIEAYGLWLARQWGEWLALISAALYIPFIIKALIKNGPSWWNVSLLLLNVAFVAYLSFLLVKTRRRRAHTALASIMGETLETSVGDR